MKPDLWAVIPVKPFALGKSRLGGRARCTKPHGAQPETVRSCVRHGGCRPRGQPRRGGDFRPRTVRCGRCSRRARHRQRWRSECRARPRMPPCLPRAARRRSWCCRATFRSYPRTISPRWPPPLPPAPGLVIAPDASEQATNALVLSPPDPDFFHFGPSSFAAHLHAARERGMTIEIVRRPGLAFDLDTPEDYREFLKRTGAPAT